jgi:hypothetical protein
MVVPIIGRDIAAVVGGLLVATGAASVIGTLIAPRSVANWLTRWVDLIVNGAVRLATRHVAGYLRRARVLAAQAGHHPDRAAGRQAGAGSSTAVAPQCTGRTLACWPSATRR